MVKAMQFTTTRVKNMCVVLKKSVCLEIAGLRAYMLFSCVRFMYLVIPAVTFFVCVHFESLCVARLVRT